MDLDADAGKHRNQAVLGAFISGLEDPIIWQSLLEIKKIGGAQ